MRVTITVRPLGQGKVAISTLDAETGHPLEDAWTGPYYAALRERNRRCERWSESAQEVTGEKMPVHF